MIRRDRLLTTMLRSLELAQSVIDHAEPDFLTRIHQLARALEVRAGFTPTVAHMGKQFMYNPDEKRDRYVAYQTRYILGEITSDIVYLAYMTSLGFRDKETGAELDTARQLKIRYDAGENIHGLRDPNADPAS